MKSFLRRNVKKKFLLFFIPVLICLIILIFPYIRFEFNVKTICSNYSCGENGCRFNEDTDNFLAERTVHQVLLSTNEDKKTFIINFIKENLNSSFDEKDYNIYEQHQNIYITFSPNGIRTKYAYVFSSIEEELYEYTEENFMEIKKVVNKVKLLSNSQKEKVKSEYSKCLPKGFTANYFEDGYEYIDGKVYYYFSYGRSRGYFEIK